MTTSTDGIICYGIQLDEDQEFPWDDERHDGDIESWWIEDVLGYEPPFPIYDEDGEWIDGLQPSEERRDRYYTDRREFKNSHPLPIELVQHCSGDYPMYIVAIKGTVKTASRGRPQPIYPSSNTVSQDGILMIAGFCMAYGLETCSDPSWWLASYWG